MKYKNSKAPYSSKYRLCESQNKKTVNPHRLFEWAKSKEKLAETIMYKTIFPTNLYPPE